MYQSNDKDMLQCIRKGKKMFPVYSPNNKFFVFLILYKYLTKTLCITDGVDQVTPWSCMDEAGCDCP